MDITMIGMDTSKSVFQVHAVVLPLMTGPRLGRTMGEWKKLGWLEPQMWLGSPSGEGWQDRYASLTSREHDVMALVVSGLMNKQVGGELGISEITVKAHRGRMM